LTTPSSFFEFRIQPPHSFLSMSKSVFPLNLLLVFISWPLSWFFCQIFLLFAESLPYLLFFVFLSVCLLVKTTAFCTYHYCPLLLIFLLSRPLFSVYVRPLRVDRFFFFFSHSAIPRPLALKCCSLEISLVCFFSGKPVVWSVF